MIRVKLTDAAGAMLELDRDEMNRERRISVVGTRRGFVVESDDAAMRGLLDEYEMRLEGGDWDYDNAGAAVRTAQAAAERIRAVLDSQPK